MPRDEMSRDEMRRALGNAPLPEPDRHWAAIRQRLAVREATPRAQVRWPVALAAGLGAIVLGVAGGSYWQFAAPSAWTVANTTTALDTAWTDVRGDTLRVTVGRIGEVALAPGARARVQRGAWNEHRLELASGAMRAVIAAPPRLFFVQTPTALATDLGCAYELSVLPDGSTSLRVTAGWVELARDDARSIVPAGLMATVAADGQPSVPADPALSEPARAALRRLSGAAGAQLPAAPLSADARDADFAMLFAALDALDASRPANIRRQTSGITLWHLLQRVPTAERARVHAALIKRAPAPEGVSREGILALDRQMLDRWRRALHPMWGEDRSPIVALAQRAWLAVMD